MGKVWFRWESFSSLSFILLKLFQQKTALGLLTKSSFFNQLRRLLLILEETLAGGLAQLAGINVGLQHLCHAFEIIRS
jgi:hypothetical protein